MLCCVVEDLNNTTNSMVIHINKKRDEHNKNISVLFPESMHVSAACKWCACNNTSGSIIWWAAVLLCRLASALVASQTCS